MAATGHATFWTQAGALFRRNGSSQRRAWGSNARLLLVPILLCLLLFILDKVIVKAFNTTDQRCGCLCTSCCVGDPQVCRPATADTPCLAYEDCKTYDESQCGLAYSSAEQSAYCGVPNPASWPAIAQVPREKNRPEPWSPAAALLYTGGDPAAAGALAAGMFPNPDPSAAGLAAGRATLAAGAALDTIYASAVSLLGVTLGTYQMEDFFSMQVEPAFIASDSRDALLYAMVANASDPGVDATIGALELALSSALLSAGVGNDSAWGSVVVLPTDAEPVWETDADAINSALYCGYGKARCPGRTLQAEEYVSAVDFGSSAPGSAAYQSRVWFNGTDRYDNGAPQLVRVNAAINAGVNAWLRAGPAGPEASARLVGLMDVPKPETEINFSISSFLGPLFFTWVLQMLLPTILVALVTEKERRLRSMMKMHGLGDGAYWVIQYAWFFALTYAFSWVLIAAGSATQLSFFRATSYSFQFVFYFLWCNCMVAFAFFTSTLFTSARTANVVAFLYAFATGLLGSLLLEQFIVADYWWVVFIELIPGFALFRGLYEISVYAFRSDYIPVPGLTWSNLSDPGNGMRAVMIIMAVEWFVFLVLAWYLEQVLATGVGIARHPLFFLGINYDKKGSLLARWRRRREARLRGRLADESTAANGDALVRVQPDDVAREAARVADTDPNDPDAAIVIRDLLKVFPARGGNPELVAVNGLSLRVARGECFGLLGPNGAGKSTTINMLTGFLTPSGGSARVKGYDITADMPNIYALMGVCPQHDLLWEDLTAREHLLFYGRLKSLRGPALAAAVDAALASVNLLHGGVGDKRVGRYSGGMKRRLSVAISFMGDPAVVYLDEPSTGLDPASRQNLWDVVRQAKAGRGIILTTHSMEEAGVLCDRLGIFVDGGLVCIGNPRELTARHGSYYVFSITVPQARLPDAHVFVTNLCPGARLTYAVAGTRKYELPVDQVTLAGVFGAVAAAQADLGVLDWAVANATLEEVFIKFAKDTGVEGGM